jgi:hypothetical protein
MTYDEFERIGLEESTPYAWIKIAWEAQPWAGQPFKEEALRRFFRVSIDELPNAAVFALEYISSQEVAPGALESIGRNLRS